jgi:diguanylate cyclase (GGDEF)-like protein/PAS domain S-box-containing protein
MKKNRKSEKVNPLRKKAESLLRKQDKKTLYGQSPEDSRKLIYELQVHQIELEMQNEELRASQEELEESRSRYSDLYDFAPVGYFTLDKNGLILKVNLTGAKQLGIGRRLLHKKPFSRLISRDTQDTFYFHLKEVFDKKLLTSCEIILKKKDKSEFHARLTSMAQADNNGIYNQVRTAVSDITLSKQAEERLSEREARYRSFIELTEQLGWTTNADGEIEEDIPTWRKYTGQSKDEIKGWGWSKALHPDDVKHTTQAWKQAVKTKSIYEVEYRIRRHDGIYRHFLARGVPVLKKDGGIREWVGTCIDISERKSMEEELKIKQRLNKLLIDSLPHSAMLIRKDRKIIAANKMAEEVGAIVGGYCWQDFGKCQFIPEEHRQYIDKHGRFPDGGTRCYFCNADEAMKSKGPVNIDVNAWDRTWDTYWIPLDEEMYLHYAIDITERKKAEEQIVNLSKFPSEDPNPVLRMDGKGKILYKNEAVMRLLRNEGLKEEDVIKILPAHIKNLINKTLKSKKALNSIEVNLRNRIYAYSINPVSEHQYVNLYATDITERRQAEKELAKSELRYRTLFDSAADSIYLIDLRTQKIIDCNSKASKTSGYTIRQLKGKKMKELFPREEQIIVSSILKKINETGSLSGITGIHQLRRDGKLIPLDVNATMIELAGKSYCLGIFRDITARMLAEYALRESEDRYQRLSEASFEGIIVHDNGKIVDVNETLARMFGYKRPEVIGMNLQELFSPEYRDMIPKETSANYKRTLEAMGIRKNSTSFPVEIRGRSIQYHGKTSCVAIIRDISERVLAETALRYSEAQYRSLVDNSLVGIFKSNLKGEILYVNEASARMFDYQSPEELMSVGALLHSKNPQDREMFIRQLKKKGKVTNYALDVLTKSGSSKHILINATLDTDIISGMALDITKRKELEDKLQAVAITDDLTGLFNRRGFITLAGQQCKLADRSKSDICLLYLDLNGLKTINDELGHKAGDKALIDTANILKNTFREADIIGRIGGDEFAVLLSDSSIPGTENIIVSHLESNINKFNKRKNQKYKLSVSAGVAHFEPGNKCTIDNLLTRADKLMYEDKNRRLENGTIPKSRRKRSEKRAHERFDADDRFTADLDIAGTVRIKNISSSGICLKTSNPLTLNKLMRIKKISVRLSRSEKHSLKSIILSLTV